MNRVGSMDEIMQALGEKGLADIEELQGFLQKTFQWPMCSLRQLRNFRYAPSIISRGEAEIFNVTLPRFALRVYLDHNQKSFVNARRIGVLCDQARRWSSKRTNLTEEGVRQARRKLFKGSPAWVLRKHTCVADSLLDPSSISGYHVLQAQLGEVYGEGQEILGTPYLRHIPLTGGLCAQAVCFMATALLHDHARGVHSLPDVTALAAGNLKQPGELILRGLDHRELAEYFSNSAVGLGAIWQRAAAWYPDSGAQFSSGRFVPTHQGNAFAKLIRAYLLSGMPVILPIDAGREAGLVPKTCPLVYKSIFEENGLAKDLYLPDSYTLRRRDHAVILVGCNKDGNNTRDFLFNDPSVFPFMKVSAEQVFDAACYVPDSDFRELNTPPWFLPVTPSEVKVPLGDWRPASDFRLGPETPAIPGLLRVVQYFQADLGCSPLPVFPTPYDPGDFRLLKLSEIPEAHPLREIGGTRSSQKAFADWCRQLRDKCTNDGDRWCWLQYSDNTRWKGTSWCAMWIWDAEKALPDSASYQDTRFRECLIAVLVWTQREFEVPLPLNFRSNAVQLHRDVEPAPQDAQKPAVKKSLITSFSLHGVEQSRRLWPKETKYCDIYTFMQSDAERFLRPHRLFALWLAQLLRYTVWAKLSNVARCSPIHTYWSGRRLRLNPRRKKSLPVSRPVISAMERMADLSLYPSEINDCAGQLDGLLGRPPEILAMASFLPGLASQDERAATSRSALVFLIRLAQQFQHQSRRQCCTIEIVAGSLFDGTWPGILENPTEHRRDRTVFVANILSHEKAISNLLENIKLVFESVSPQTLKRARVTENYPDAVQLAIELEPGPYFVINSWDTIEKLCDSLDSSPISQFVGLNLDIAHWTLAGIKPEWVSKSAPVRKRVIHCHISDHGKGHFCDVALGRIHPRGYFGEWVQLLHQISKEKREPCYPRWNGGIAIELEACKTIDLVGDSATVLSELVGDPEDTRTPLPESLPKERFTIQEYRHKTTRSLGSALVRKLKDFWQR